ncbi:MAG: nucleotide sugar dehydrogenase [Candidatus Cloacimonadota bacterium]|nr:nucleotide sugar dehydrogenase [Candidatus Cloacimonadota bacterium]
MSISIAPDGRKYKFPTKEANKEELKKLITISEEQKKMGRKIVVVQGMGFVGSVMAAVVADAEDADGNSPYFVHGHDLVSPRSFWKIHVINSGQAPVSAEDPEISKIFPRVVNGKKTLRATWHEHVYKLADFVVVDIQLDAIKPKFGNANSGYCDLSAFKKGMRTIGKNIQPDCLILIETTVPPGTCQNVIKPIIEDEFKKRGINTEVHSPRIAHSYERVMPGKNYVGSIQNFPRTFSGIDKKSADLAEEFLENVLRVDKNKITRLGNTNASELAKVMENSYRATNIALLSEWSKMAEKIGVNIFEIIESIKVRKGTHDNMLNPSLGVGGYCLTKDPVLANWAARDIFHLKEQLPMAVHSVDINDKMPLHTVELIEDVFPHLIDKKVTILGVSYQKDVADTRHSPSKLLWDELMKKDAIIKVHDPYVKIWHELGDMRVEKDLQIALEETEILIFAVGHSDYMQLEPEFVVESAKNLSLVVDCSNFLSDEKIKKYLDNGCEIRAIGKGHIKDLK